MGTPHHRLTGRHAGALCALSLTLLAQLPAQAQAQVSPAATLLWSSLGKAAGVALSPESMAAIALNPPLWYGIFAVAGPEFAPYAKPARALALTAPPRLKPIPTPPQAVAQTFGNSYTQVVSFGDSMSDNGNMFDVTKAVGGVGLPTAPNDRGRFSDGPVVLEVMSSALSIPLLNYAFGGAESGTRGLLPARAAQIGMLKQISDFLANQPSSTKPVDAQALYVLWTGPDDFYVDGNIFNKSTVNTVTANVKTGMTTLYKRGARQFFVPMMPDLSITPSATIKDKTIKGYFASSKLRSAELATSMTAMLKAFAKQYPSAQIRTFDTYTYSQTRRAQAASEGMNVTEPCYTPTVMGLPGPVCANPDAYLFWDTQHPTAAASLVIGTDFAKAAVAAALPSR